MCWVRMPTEGPRTACDNSDLDCCCEGVPRTSANADHCPGEASNVMQSCECRLQIPCRSPHHINSFKLFLEITWEFRRNIPETVKDQWGNQHFRSYLGKIETPYKTCRKWTFCRKTSAQVGRTLTAPRAGAPFAGHSLLPRCGTRVIQETPQWLPARAPSATLGHCR